MPWSAALAACLLAPASYLGALLAVNGRRRSGEPPLLRGRVPFLGMALPFGRDGMTLLAELRAQHGDVFTLFIAGQRMTFMLDPLGVPAVLKSEMLRFKPVADDVLVKGFGIEDIERVRRNEELERASKIYLKGEHLRPLTTRMEEQLRRLLPERLRQTDQLELYRFISDVMFEAATEALFGAGDDVEALARSFADFDRDFPLLVAGLPRFLTKNGVAGRDALARRLSGPTQGPSAWVDRREAIIEQEGIGSALRGRMQTTVLWAAQANTLPATFWTVAHLLRHPEAEAAVRAELEGVDIETLATDQLDSLRILDSAVRESLRLSSGSLVVRRVMEDMVLDTPGGRWALREGDRLCLASYLTHRDPEIYEEPERYRYDRFFTERGTKQFSKRGQRVPLPLMPFGGGVSMCPGRFFAINEIKLLVALVMSRADLELAAPDEELPGFDLRRAGLGIYPPARDLTVRVRPRATAVA